MVSLGSFLGCLACGLNINLQWEYRIALTLYETNNQKIKKFFLRQNVYIC
jgi:hypothetical protein